MNNKKKCFVIMPVSATKSCTADEWTGIFEHMIKPAITGSRLGFECERAKPRSGAFIRDILDGLNRADVVIADLTDKNPNVCYELGIRHTLRKRTILIAQSIEDVPSDLQSYWVVTYAKDLTGAEKLKRRVREILREMQKDPEKPDSPVADFLVRKNIDILSTQKSDNYKKLTAIVSQLSYNLALIDLIIKKARENKKKRERDETYLAGLDVRLDISSLDLLLSTHYILVHEDVLKAAINARRVFISTNAKIDCWHELERAPDIDDKFVKFLPIFKKDVISLLKKIDKIRHDYANDNYIEPETPNILLSSPKHEKYLQE